MSLRPQSIFHNFNKIHFAYNQVLSEAAFVSELLQTGHPEFFRIATFFLLVARQSKFTIF
jgi:hypothetical protein